jgi:hypothetical protein
MIGSYCLQVMVESFFWSYCWVVLVEAMVVRWFMMHGMTLMEEMVA